MKESIIPLIILAIMFISAHKFHKFTLRKKPELQGVIQLEVYKKEKRTIKRVK